MADAGRFTGECARKRDSGGLPLSEFELVDFEAIFNTIATPILVLAPDFTMLAANDARLEATMTTRETTIGKPLFEVFPDNPNDPASEGVRNLKASLNFSASVCGSTRSRQLS